MVRLLTVQLPTLFVVVGSVSITPTYLTTPRMLPRNTFDLSRSDFAVSLLESFDFHKATDDGIGLFLNELGRSRNDDCFVVNLPFALQVGRAWQGLDRAEEMHVIGIAFEFALDVEQTGRDRAVAVRGAINDDEQSDFGGGCVGFDDRLRTDRDSASADRPNRRPSQLWSAAFQSCL